MFAYDVALMVFGFVFVALFSVVGVWALRGRIKPDKPSAFEFVFRSPTGLVQLQLVGMLFPLILGLLSMPPAFSDIVRQHLTGPVAAAWTLAFGALYVGCPLGLIALWLGHNAGPQELHLNRQQRTYFLRSGTLLKPVTRAGTWDDIRGVFIRPIRDKGGRAASYGVYLAWQQGLSGGPPLGLSRWQEQAEWLAGERARELGLPVVEPPLTGFMRTA